MRLQKRMEQFLFLTRLSQDSVSVFGGAQEWFGIKPDLSTFGKIVGGGMPMAIYGGRKDIMRNISPTGKVYQAGTLSGNPIATTAGIKTLEILRDHPELYTKIEENTKKLAEAYKVRAKKQGIQYSC